MLYKLRDCPFEEFSKACTESYSVAEICRKLGLATASSAYDRIRIKAQKHNISLSHINTGISHNRGKSYPLTRSPIERILKSGQRGWIKQAIRRENLIDYNCQRCTLPPIWNGVELVLRLDHINGDPNDNRLENFRFVCPNCDSQLPTFSGRNLKHPKKKCLDCSSVITKSSRRCADCNGLRSRKFNWPSAESILDRLKDETYASIAASLGCSTNSVKKHLVRSGALLPTVPKGPRPKRC